MKHILLPGLIFFSTILFAQKQTTDLVTYTPPKGWKKETVANSGVKYTTTNKNSFCVLGIYNSSNSEGTIETDFNREWEELVVNALKPDSVSNKEKGVANNGFENMMGVTTFTFGGTQALAMLSVYSGHGKRTSILVLSNDQEYLNELDIFIASISIKKPDHKIINENNDKGGSAIPLQLMQFDWKQTSNQKDALNNYAGYSTNTYNFKSNNTYQFSRVDFKSYTPKYYLEDEVGTYKVNGN
ncbi:MAG: hypothetical protein ACXWC7_10385, partial [Chitinophagaceae bacterium]